MFFGRIMVILCICDGKYEPVKSESEEFQMNQIKIIADSTCDLTEEQIAKYDITILPLNIVLDMDSFYDKEEITPEELFQWAQEHHKTPKTAAPGIEKAIQVFRPFAEQKMDIIFIGISEAMSTTCNVVRLVKEELEYERIFVIDSGSLSSGIGLQILKAARLREQGLSAEAIEEQILQAREHVRASFVVDTMEYLAMGGRCSSVKALLATTLKIHPMIGVNNGRMGVERKYRGNINKAIRNYAEDLREELLQAEPETVFITHSPCDPGMVASVRAFLEELNYFQEIVESSAGGVICSHCGPGTLGVLFYHQSNL